MKSAKQAANRERWRKEVVAWRVSGKALSVWARERGLSRAALEYWKRRLPEERPTGSGVSPLTLIPLRPAAVERSVIELVSDAHPGVRIRVPADVEVGCLARLLGALES